MTATRTAKKAIGLDLQNNNFAYARASLFFVNFFAVSSRLISRFVEDVNTRRFSFSFPEL